MESSNPGIVYLRNYATDNETAVSVLKSKDQRFSQLCPELPEVIPVKGLEPQRQWYLYEEVAPYCSNTEVCPRPACPKPVIKVESQMHADSDDIKKRKCSHCKKLGHCRSKSGKILCPDLVQK